MTSTKIDLDDVMLAAAARVLGTETEVDTVNTALRAVVTIGRQRTTLERAAKDGTYRDVASDDEAWR